MRIDGLHIDGFGLFHQFTIKGISPRVTVFLGQNESGKSTLLGFIRAIFFGFPDGRTNENPYPPLAGGRHGGNISLKNQQNETYVVERYPGHGGGKVDVLNPDHTHGGKEVLTALLGTDNRALFKHIYAFSLSELQYFESLNTDSVRESLYSAGAGIDPKSLASLKSMLEKKDADLFKPGGNRPKINQLTSRLSAIHREMKDLQGAVAEYDEIKGQIVRFSREIDALEDRRTEVTLKLKKVENLIDIQPDWSGLTTAQNRLKNLEPIESFPLQGIMRLEGLYSRIEALELERLTKQEELQRQESELPSLSNDLDMLQYAESIRRLQKDQGHYEALIKDLLSLEQEIPLHEQKFNQDLTRLGPWWTEKQVEDFDLSIAAREQVRHLRERLEQARFEAQRKKDSLETVFLGKREAEERLERLDEPSVKDHTRLLQSKGFCRELRDILLEERLAKEAGRYLDERLKDLEEEKKMISEIPFYQEAKWPFRIIMGAWGIGVLFLFWFGRYTGIKWPLSAVVGSLMVGIALWIISAQIIKKNLRRNQVTQNRSFTLVTKIRELESKKNEAQTRMSQIQKQKTSLSTGLSLSEPPTTVLMEQMEQDFTDQMSQLLLWLDARRDAAQTEKRYHEAQADLKQAESDANHIRNAWLAWLEERHLDQALSPEGVLETFSLIESCKEQIKNLHLLKSRRNSLEAAKAEYLAFAEPLFEIYHKKPKTDHETLHDVQDLIQYFTESEKASQKRQILLNEIRSSRASLDRIDEQIKRIKKEIQNLLSSGGAANEDVFRKRAQTFQERNELMKDIRTYEDRIRRLSGKWGGMKKVIQELLIFKMEDLEAQKMAYEKELNETETALEHLKQNRAGLDERLRQLVNDERISLLRAEEEGLKEELASLSEEWITVKLAQGLIKMAGARFEKERQPKVISEAGRFFKQLTLGKYPSIVAPIGEDRIEVMCMDNSRKEIAHLSRGTAEQLYLSLRFGFIMEFSKRSGSLPIIMDEILVNFDMDRAKAAVQSIVDLSREHQVLYFTCHPMTAELFKQVDPAIPIIEISQGDVKRACL
ncbi:MAG: AAA family ATPase [Deltaproteobacteria bacterium]|nr:AAA family ATPase [Deltaproteobacteria bacterium]